MENELLMQEGDKAMGGKSSGGKSNEQSCSLSPLRPIKMAVGVTHRPPKSSHHAG